MKPWHWLLWGCFLSQAIAFSLKAQIIPDGTTDTITSPTNNGTIIESGDRAGNNLFHSFTEFSIPTGREVLFNNPNDIINIFSRVTGGNISNIDGLIRANGNANLFLINPAGIIFGENASLDIGGSFFASTAESIVFRNNIDFSATNTNNAALLTINQPLGLNFGNNIGDIAVNGSNLEVNNGATIGLLGGNIDITSGQISASGGSIELGSLTQPGKIEFNNLSIDFPSEITRGDITLTNGADISVQASGGGNIGIHSRNLSLSGGELGASNLRAGIVSQSQSSAAQAGDITIDLSGNLSLLAESSIINRIELFGRGDTGDIEIVANNLFMSGGGLVSTDIFGNGNAGNISVNISNAIAVRGTASNGQIPSGIFNVVLPGGIGNAGNIDVTTTQLNLTEGGAIAGTTIGQGNGGQVRVNAKTITAEGESPAGLSSGIFSTVSQTAIGDAGNIEIATDDLVLIDGGRVSVNTFGRGNGGNIAIAAEEISIQGTDADEFSSGIFSTVSETATGDAGNIEIATDNLVLIDGGRVSVNTFGRGNGGTIAIAAEEEISIQGIDADGFSSGIFSQVQPEGIGNAGDIEIATGNLTLFEGGVISVTTLGRGSAGKATIFASEIAIAGETAGESNSGIYSQVQQGAIGDSMGIELTANNLTLTEGGAIDVTTSSQGRAGAIDLNVLDTISIDGEDTAGNPSGIIGRVTSLQPSNSAGIRIDTSNLFLTNGGVVSASTFGLGNAGAVSIEASDIISADGELSNGRASGVYSIVTPTGEGNAGGIEIKTTDLFLSGGGLISASTLGQGNAGDIEIEVLDTIAIDGEALDGFSSGIKSIVTPEGEGNSGAIDITTGNIVLTGGGAIDTTTFGRGNAGSIAIAATGNIAANGSGRILADEETRNNSGIISAVGNRATGNAAGIDINTKDLILSDNGEISVESLGRGNAGNLNLEANSLSLSQASLFASTPVGNGGNINLQIAENITISDRSTISAQALADANGGNINIDAQFIIAIDNNNNDIIASASRGVGGNINLTTNSLFNIAERNSTLAGNTNDIDASSQFGLDGTIAINELDINPAEALSELPIEIIDVTKLIAQNLCQQGKGSEFIVTGKGGMGSNPLQTRNGEIDEVDLLQPAIAPQNDTNRGDRSSSPTDRDIKPEIIEAQGWIINDRGNLELTIQKIDTLSYTPQTIGVDACQVLKY